MTQPVSRILVVSPLWPHPEHSVRAANVVVYALIREMARRPGVRVGLLKFEMSGAVADPLQEAAIRDLEALGIEVLEPFRVPPLPEPRLTIAKLLFGRLADYYPETVHRPLATAAALAFRPDLLFVPWSETGTSLFAEVPARRFAYYGNPDAKSLAARREFAREHGGSLKSYLGLRLLCRKLAKFHLETMKRYHLLGDVAANDADYYRRQGHPGAFYIRNLWVDRLGEAWRERRRAERTDPAVIIASIGKLDGTANTHGLELLGRDYLPALRQAMAGRPYEVHILGAGQAHPAVAGPLAQPEVRFRGFVPDIDEEMLTAPVFLCLNNASRYKVGHTRYLHAWSLGCCVVAHRDTALSMPELVHDRNCLLGDSVAETARLTAAALADPALRRRLGAAGYETFRTLFQAPPVVDEIFRRLAPHPVAATS